MPFRGCDKRCNILMYDIGGAEQLQPDTKNGARPIIQCEIFILIDRLCFSDHLLSLRYLVNFYHSTQYSFSLSLKAIDFKILFVTFCVPRRYNSLVCKVENILFKCLLFYSTNMTTTLCYSLFRDLSTVKGQQMTKKIKPF